MECPVCTEEFDSPLPEWSAVECPACGTIWIGGDPEWARVLVEGPHA